MASNQAVSISRDTEIPVFAGSEILSFAVQQMPPNTRIYSYVNGVNITPFTAPTPNSKIGDPIFTDQLGTATGFLYIPSVDNKYRFLTGEIRITFADTPDGIQNAKFISETTLFNHGLSLVDTEQGTTVSLRSVEKIRADVSGTSSEKVTNTYRRLDPLAQSFVVDSSKYPLGMVLTGISMFFYTKDDKLPISLELRPMVSGVPSTTEFLSGSYVSLNPTAVKVYDAERQNAPPTHFTFQHPIYLKPGEYAFCIMSNSSKYQILSAKQDEEGGKTVKVPFAGSLFKPQNTGEWVADITEDLTFLLRKAKFETGTITFEAQSKKLYPLDFNRLRLLSTQVDFGTTAYADYRIRTTSAGSGKRTEYKDVLHYGEPDLDGRMVANNLGDISVEISLTSKSPDVSPILDRQLLKAQIFSNNISPYSTVISDSELYPRGGFAKSRYISKIVPLQEGFDSTGLEVKLLVNRKIGTDIEVFGRVLSRQDKSLTNGIMDRPWTRLPLVQPITKTFAGTSDELFFEEIYRTLEPGLSYDYVGNTTIASSVTTTAEYIDFAFYQIKVVFYAQDPSYLPKIKDLVAIALI